MRIIPAILEKNFFETEKKLEFLTFLKRKYSLAFDTIQIDFCDGIFVENKTWILDLSKKDEVSKIISYREIFNIEYHLMCENQYDIFLNLLEIGVKRIVVHIDNIFNSNELLNILKKAEENFVKIIITSKLSFMDTNREQIISFLNKYKNIDLQIMGIDRIGTQGIDFDEKCLSLVKFFRKNFTEKDLYIQIDGSMNEDTILLAKKAGVNGAIVGSYLMKDLHEMKFISRFKDIKSI